MMQPEIALAVSPRSWAQDLDQFIADHGGARVRTRVMSAEEAAAESYDVLIVDDVTSFVTPRLVERIRLSGRLLLGVYDPDEKPEGKERLVEIGVDDVIEATATPDEFLIAIRALALGGSAGPIETAEPASAASPPAQGRLVVVAGAAGGVGATEVSVVLAFGLSRSAPTLLVDGDDQNPGVAQRLALSLHPGLRTALDHHQHRTGAGDEALQRVPGTKLQVLAGLATPSDWFDLYPPGILDLLGSYRHSLVVVNIGPSIEAPTMTAGPARTGLARAVLRAAEGCIVVAEGSPVGLTRLLEWLAQSRTLTERSPLLVINRAPRSPYRRAEIARELARAGAGEAVVFAPSDRRVSEAAWDGSVVTGGPFFRSVRPLVRTLVESAR